MKLSLDGFKKISKDGNTTVLRHPAGHQMTINHSILSPKMRGEIEALPSEQKDVAGNNHPDKKPSPHFDDGGEVETPVKEVENSYNKFAGTMKPNPPPMTREEKNTAIRKRNSSNASGETSVVDQPVYAEGGDVEESRSKENLTPEEFQKHLDDLKESGKKVEDVQGEPQQADASKVESQYGGEQEEANKSVDQSPQAQVEDESDSQPPVQPEQPYDHAKAMLESHANMTEAHNNAMKLYAASQQAGQQPQSTSSQPNQSQDQTQPNVPGQQPPSAQQPMSTDYKGNVSAAQTGIQDLQSYHADQEKKNQDLFNKVIQDKVDPNRFWNNKSTGTKIVNTIGLILGGLGAGATGGKNLAVDAMNQAIERDVDAQKSNISQGDNLYKMNLEATKDATEARAMTINQQLTMAQAQLTKRASDNQSQMSQLEAQKAIQDIQKLKLENNMSAFRSKTLNDLQSTPSNVPPGKLDLDRFNKLQLSGVMPKEDVTAATKEAGNYQEAQELRKDMEGSAKHLDKQIGAGAFTPSDRDSAVNAFAGRIAKVAEGRFNLEESKLQAKALLPSTGDLPSTVKNKAVRRQQFFDSLVATPTLERYKLKSSASPESTEIKNMNGIPYQLGADGQYHRVK